MNELMQKQLKIAEAIFHNKGCGGIDCFGETPCPFLLECSDDRGCINGDLTLLAKEFIDNFQRISNEES